MYSRVFFVVVSSFFCFECAVLSGKALFCRDPDSGKLHAVNTTWASSSFCGNYTCKLRKRNTTKDLIRQFNITNTKQNNNKTDHFELRNENVQPINKHKNTNVENVIDIEKQLKYYENKLASTRSEETYESINNKPTSVEVSKNNVAQPKTTERNLFKEFHTLTTNNNERNDDDRYLNEYEIKAITDILQTVKKSDLYALIDIYNLANEIYKELDASIMENLNDETTTKSALENEKKLKKEKKSYWYDSLASKGKIQEIVPLDPKETLTTVPVINDNPPDFNEAVSNKELSQLPFYYPISDFQRLSSYKHEPKIDKPVREVPKTKENDKKSVHHQKKEIQRSYLLPYPFAYVNHYNVSDLPNYYYNNPSWRAEYYNRYRYYQPYYNAFIAQIPNAIIYSDEVQDIEQRPIINHKLDEIKKVKNKPDWKTDPIPREDIEEIRANVDTSKYLSFPLRKLVKLDTVGKLGKVSISEESFRRKRSPYEYKFTFNIENVDGHDGDYETYLEKITCTHQTDLGFFRIGNLSQPFPQCCPQLIKTVHNVIKIK